jgi:hypothetical protein
MMNGIAHSITASKTIKNIESHASLLYSLTDFNNVLKISLYVMSLTFFLIELNCSLELFNFNENFEIFNTLKVK